MSVLTAGDLHDQNSMKKPLTFGEVGGLETEHIDTSPFQDFIKKPNFFYKQINYQ